MSFGGFGTNSGPGGPPKAQPTFGHFSQTPSPPVSAPPFPRSATPPQSPNPRTFGSFEGVRSPLPFDNARRATGTPRPSVPSIRPASLQWGDRQSSRTPDVSGPIPKRSPPSGPRDYRTNISPKAYGVQDLGKIRPPPVQYTEDLLNPDTDSNERPASLQWGDRPSSRTLDVSGSIPKRSPPTGPRDHRADISPKAYVFQDPGKIRPPPVQYTEDLLNPDTDSNERAVPLQWGNRQSSPAGHVHPIQKRSPPSGPRDLGASISSKAYQFRGVERTRSPPVQYTEDFLNPDNDGKEGAGPLRWSDRQSSLAGGGDVGSSTKKRSSLSAPHDLGTSISSKAYRLQNPERTRSPPVQYTEDFLNPDKDGEERASLFPPTSRSRTGVLGMPKFQHNQRSSPSADGMNGDAHAKGQVSHSVSKRNRSPPAAVTDRISLTSTYPEDDSERELQAKARRLARFKTELDEVEPSDTNQYGSNAAGKKVSSVKTDRPSKEKKNFPGDDGSRSMEQDFDNEDLQTSGVIVGLCPDMCPESERAERERKGDLDRYERLDGDRNQTSRTLAVKKYNRTAEREPELIRPMPILQKTMDYLLGLLEQPYDERFLGLYNFLWDRMRAIRMDLRMQHIFNLEAITMLEQMIRLHIIVMHELCEFPKGEGFSEGFDAHLNIEQMNKTSVELFQLYDDHRKRGILVPTEKEFRGYYALLKLDKHPGYKVEPAELSLDLAKMTVEMRQTHEVLFARNVARSCRTSNFIAFFRHARKGSYHQACLMHAHFSKLRTQALASLHSGLLNNQGLPVSHVATWLGMEGEDIESLLEYHGFSIREYEEPYMVKEGPFLNADKDYPTRRSELVHEKRSSTIVEDILSSRQETTSRSEFKREIQVDKNKKSKPAVPQRKRPPETLIASDEVMDVEAVPSPKATMRVEPVLATSSMQVQPLFGSPRGGQPSSEDRHRTSVSSPKSHIAASNVFPSFQSPRMQEQPSPVPGNGSLNLDTSPLPGNFSIPQSIPDAQPPLFGWARETSQDGFVRSPRGASPRGVVHSAMQPHDLDADDGRWIQPASELDSVAASLQKDGTVAEEAMKELTDGHHEVENDDDVSCYSEEVAKAKLKLLIRLWKRHSARRRAYRELNRSAAIAALSTLSLGPPIQQIKDKHMPCRKLNIDQAVHERHEKLQQSWSRWNVSEVVAGKLGEKNANSNCICWKVVSFSWSHRNIDNIEARSSINHLSLDQWLQYKLIPAQEDDTIDDLVISAPGLSIWSKWVPDRADAITCCLSVIKGAESGNFEKKLAGASAILFPVSETVPWELQRVELHNLVMHLPAGSRIPLLVLSGYTVDNIGEVPQSMAEKLGLNDLDKSRVGSVLVICLNEREGTDQYYGYFSDQKLKEGLMWLASESHPQPVLYDVTLRELVSSHLNLCLDSFGTMGSDKLSPNQCISAFNEALDRSINNIAAAANMNPTGWPCPEVFLLDDSAAEFGAVRLFLPSLGWSSPDEIEPLISALRNCKLPSFSDDISWLNRGCTNIQDFESQRRLLQDSLIKYLSQSSNVMNWMMATKEADVMLEKCTRLELHDTEYRLVPYWQLIFRRVFNWQLSKLAGITRRAYVLEEPRATLNPTFFEKLDFEVSASRFIDQPSLDEMVEVSCSPIVSKRIKSSPKSFQDVSILTPVNRATGLAMFGYSEEENKKCSPVQVQNRFSPVQVQNQFSPIQVQPINFSDSYIGEIDSEVVPKVEKEPDRLSKLLEQCNALQDDIEKKLSIYF